MEILKKAFGEVSDACRLTFSKYKNIKKTLLFILILTIAPTIISLAYFGTYGGSMSYMTPAEIYFIETGYLLVLLISFLSIVYSMSITIGFFAKNKEVLKGEKNTDVSHLANNGMKKIIPSIVIGVYSVLPLITSIAFVAAFADVFKKGSIVLLVIMVVLSLIWMFSNYFAKCYLIVDDKLAEESIFKSIILFSKNFWSLVIRFIVVLFYIILPTTILLGIINSFKIYSIKNMMGLPSYELTLKFIEKGVLSPAGQWLNLLLDSVSTTFIVLVVMPVVVVYIYNLFNTLKKDTKITVKENKKNKRAVLWWFLIVAIMSVSVLIKVSI